MSITDIYQAVIAFDDDRAARLTKAELDQGTDLKAVLNDGLIAPMDEVGRRFSSGELFVPEMLMAAQAMKAGLAQIKPLMTESQSQSKGTVVIGTVKGDLHDIGKNLVAMMLEGAGFNVIDLGVDVEADRFVSAAKENQARVVALSALLTTTMPSMEQVVVSLKEQGLGVKTMVGGAPVTQGFARKIGADGYSEDAPSAVLLAKKLLGL